MKNTIRLYSSFSTEVVYLLLEYLLNALEASSSTEHIEDTAFDDWKSVVLKMSRKEPELLLLLTQAVLEKMETNETMKCETGYKTISNFTRKANNMMNLLHVEIVLMHSSQN